VSNIVDSLTRNKKQRFHKFFENARSRSEMVATFMAMLALVKAKRIRVDGNGEATDVILLKEKKGAKPS
jgi:segregation and condensation protein A